MHEHHNHAHSPRRLMRVAIVMIPFSLFELGIGIWLGGLSLSAEALHNFADAAAYGFTAVSASLLAKQYRHFHHNVLVPALAFTSVLVVILGYVPIAVVATQQAIESDHRVERPGVLLAVAIAGAAVNWWAYVHIQHETHAPGDAARVHAISDFLGSLMAITAYAFILMGAADLMDIVTTAFIVMMATWLNAGVLIETWRGIHLHREVNCPDVGVE